MAYEQDTVQYIKANWERGDRLAIVLLNRAPGGRVTQLLRTAEEIAGEDVQRRLRGANANGNDIYVSMNSLTPDATGRTKKDIAAVRHLYLDLDEGANEKVGRILSDQGIPKPHHVLESSPGKYQLIWSVRDFEAPAAEALMRSMAAKYGADPAATDINRVMRLPGFSNRKLEYAKQKLHFVRDVATEKPAKREYSSDDFPRIAQGERIAVAHEGRRASAGQGSRSHQDFAWAMRQLEDGKDIWFIARTLAERRPDKPNPTYYGEHTAQKAEEKFNARRSAYSVSY